jgi:hypothetical protein
MYAFYITHIQETKVVAQIAQNHVVTHFRQETIAKQFDLKNVWICSFPLVVNLSCAVVSLG